MRMTLATLAAAALLALTGCSNASTEAQEPTAPTTAQATGALADTDVLDTLGLQGKSGKEIVEALERTDADRTAGIMGSVRADEIVFSTPAGEQTVPLPEDEFYVSIAPFVDQTHECFYHNLATCQGEIVGEDLAVTITTDDGQTLVDETVTTYDNGFVGFWLPRDIAGTITVKLDGRTVEAPIATGADDPTCVTTLQLT